MEFLSVGGIKLKVTLSRAECEEYGIGNIEAGAISDEVRSSIRRILDEACARISFRAEGERLLIQVYPLGGDGAELFITKLSAIPEVERRAVSESGIVTYTDKRAYFRLSDRSALLGAARAAPHRRADVYVSNDGEYYLAMRESLLDGISDLDVLLEFGERIHRLPLGMCGEWGVAVCLDTLLSSLPLLLDKAECDGCGNGIADYLK